VRPKSPYSAKHGNSLKSCNANIKCTYSVLFFIDLLPSCIIFLCFIIVNVSMSVSKSKKRKVRKCKVVMKKVFGDKTNMMATLLKRELWKITMFVKGVYNSYWLFGFSFYLYLFLRIPSDSFFYSTLTFTVNKWVVTFTLKISAKCIEEKTPHSSSQI